MKNVTFTFSALILSGIIAAVCSLPLVANADNPVPFVTSIYPTSAAVGGPAFTLTVNGGNFVSGSLVNFNGAVTSTTYSSVNQLTALIPASDLTTAGSFDVTVTNPGPGGGISNAQVFVVNNVIPTVTSISPSSVPVGSNALTLTVNGTNFIPTSFVNFNGLEMQTSYVSSQQLTAIMNASDFSTPGSFNVTATNPGPGGGTSNAQTFIVTTPGVVTGTNPIPVLTSISPSSVPAGSNAFSMTFYGANFTSSSFARFNGIPVSTTFISPNQLVATIPSSDVALTGESAVSVTNPAPGGGDSAFVIFTATPISGTPVLPDTGFGPSVQSSIWGPALAASGILGAVALLYFGIRRMWSAK